ncbi:MAG TPA: F0F1 ATP synthase subunit A [Terracidiphilus sp.]|nr:F0F1 ATP synthase subunit A [Terracidiphilus sp.]
MIHTFFLARLIDLLLRGTELRMYEAIGISPYDAAQKANSVNSMFSLEVLVTAVLILFFVVVRLTLSVERPNPAQQLAEMIHEGVGDLGEQVVGHGFERFQAFVTCIALFILLNNLVGLVLGLIPGVETPTAMPEVPLGLAILTFLYYNFHGVRVQGLVGYLKHFAGPLWWLAPLLFPIEVISHLARMLSLTVRLYANMFASDMLTLVWFSLIPIAVPAVFLGLHFAVSVLQAFVFMLLSMIYLSMAVAEEH